MDIFKKAKTVRLKSIRDKYLVALDDEESVCQERDGSTKNAIWTVEIVKDGKNFIRLISCYHKYLTATNVPFLPGVTGKQVLQTQPEELDSSVEWEPLRDGFQARLRTCSGTYLRPNGGIPPWRNSVTHDTPHRPRTQDKVLWDVEVVENVPVETHNNHRRTQSDCTFNRSISTLGSTPKICKKKGTRLEDFI
ncbi:hypothetical protein LguiB_006408 [Lonicera macranthoides]